MVEQPRRRSKLVGTHPAEQGPEPAALPASETTVPEPTPPAPVTRSLEVVGGPESVPQPAPLVTRSRRRVRPATITDEDMVSFNCKMPRGLRRRVRIAAANHEVDIQDVVATALEEYLKHLGGE